MQIINHVLQKQTKKFLSKGGPALKRTSFPFYNNVLPEVSSDASTTV